MVSVVRYLINCRIELVIDDDLGDLRIAHILDIDFVNIMEQIPPCSETDVFREYEVTDRC